MRYQASKEVTKARSVVIALTGSSIPGAAGLTFPFLGKLAYCCGIPHRATTQLSERRRKRNVLSQLVDSLSRNAEFLSDLRRGHQLGHRRCLCAALPLCFAHHFHANRGPYLQHVRNFAVHFADGVTHL